MIPFGWCQCYDVCVPSAGFRWCVGRTLAGERSTPPADQSGSLLPEGGAQRLGGKLRPLPLRPVHAEQWEAAVQVTHSTWHTHHRGDSLLNAVVISSGADVRHRDIKTHFSWHSQTVGFFLRCPLLSPSGCICEATAARWAGRAAWPPTVPALAPATTTTTTVTTASAPWCSLEVTSAPHWNQF